MHLSGKILRIVKFGLLAIIVGILALFFFINPENGGFFPECVFHSLTGYYCPGCGSQRALHDFLHLDIIGVINNNFLFLPGGFIIVYGVSLPIINRKLGTSYPNFLYHKKTPLYIFIVIVLFGILRNLPWYPFSMLAPGP